MNWLSCESGSTFLAPTESVMTLKNISNQKVLLWTGQKCPGELIFQLSASHPTLKVFGWNTHELIPDNPRVINIYSGTSLDSIDTHCHTCIATDQSTSKHLFVLDIPIQVDATYVKIRITESFGSKFTVNVSELYLLDNLPPDELQPNKMSSSVVRTPNKANLSTLNNIADTYILHSITKSQHSLNSLSFLQSPPRINSTLEALDREIQQLHPLRNISTSKFSTSKPSLSTKAINKGNLTKTDKVYTGENKAGESDSEQPDEMLNLKRISVENQLEYPTYAIKQRNESIPLRNYRHRKVKFTTDTKSVTARFDKMKKKFQIVTLELNKQGREIKNLKSAIHEKYRDKDKAKCSNRISSTSSHFTRQLDMNSATNSKFNKFNGLRFIKFKPKLDKLINTARHSIVKEQHRPVRSSEHMELHTSIDKKMKKIEKKLKRKIDKALEHIDTELKILVEDRVKFTLYNQLVNNEHDITLKPRNYKLQPNGIN